MNQRVDREGLAIALKQICTVIAFGVVPVALVAGFLAVTYGGSTFTFDFHGSLYDGGKAILNGANPYRAGFLHRLALLSQLGFTPSLQHAVPVDPPPMLLAVTPLALLPPKAAGLLFTLGSAAALIGGLRLLGVRDWRCYGAALLSWPVLNTIRLGQVNGYLMLGVALAWRYRNRVCIPAIATAAVAVVNLFLWPVGAFLLLTRRVRTAILAVGVALAVAALAWAAIGFDGLSTYPAMLKNVDTIWGAAGISFPSVGLALGFSHAVSVVIAALTAIDLLVLAWVVSRRPDGEARAFGLAVMAGIVSSPLVWPHYLALVFVPIALVSPSLSPLWLVPLLAYVAPVDLTGGDVWKMAPYLVIELLVTAGVCWLPTTDPESAGASAGLSISGLTRMHRLTSGRRATTASRS